MGRGSTAYRIFRTFSGGPEGRARPFRAPLKWLNAQRETRELPSRLDARLAAHAATALFAGLFVIGNALDVFGETLFFAGLLEPFNHLLGGLVSARFHFDHLSSYPFIPLPLTTAGNPPVYRIATE